MQTSPSKGPSPLTSRLRRLGFLLALLSGLGLCASWWVGGLLIAPHARVVGPIPPGLRGEVVRIPSRSGSSLACWRLRPPQNKRPGVVVLLHGIRASRLAMLGRARWLLGRGYSALMVDLQAHGESPGAQITLGHLEARDVHAAVAYARRTHPGEPVGLIGLSLGGAAAVLASPRGLSAVVLEAVFSTIEEAISNRVEMFLGPFSALPTRLLLWQLQPRLGIDASQLRPLDAIPRLRAPVLVLAGKADRHTTEDETRRLFLAANKPRELWLIPGAGHVDLFGFAPAAYTQRVGAFLDHNMKLAKW